MIKSLVIALLTLTGSLNAVINKIMSEEPEMVPVDVLVDSFMQARRWL